MADVLSMDEIKLRYPNQWVLIGDPDTNNAQAVLRGTVLWHSTDRDEVYNKAIELRPKHVAFCFTGRVPQENMEFAL